MRMDSAYYRKRDADIVRRVVEDGGTLEEVANIYQITRQRVSQIVKARYPTLDLRLIRSRSEMRMITCEVCDKTFTYRQSFDQPLRRFCSRTCAGEGKKGVPLKPLEVSLGFQLYEMRCQGLSWTEIAERAGATGAVHAINYAKSYAKTHDMPWPIRLDTDGGGRGRQGGYVWRDGTPPSNPPLAYELRARGLMWKDIYLRSGHASPQSACSSARSWALRRGLPWPPVVEGTA